MNFMNKISRISNEAFPGKVPVRIPSFKSKLLLMPSDRIDITSFSEFQGNGGIFTIGFVQDLFMIDQMSLWREVWPYSVPPVRRLASILLRRTNGKMKTSM
jgi:hypothetical protein